MPLRRARRRLSSMSPTIVTKDGKPVFVTGTPGGSRIITVVLQSILDVIDYGMNVQEAADAPRIHNQWLPDVTNVERFALSPDTRRLLERHMGHKFGPPQPANHLAAILVGAPTLGGKQIGAYRFYGANDPRRNTGLAAGVLRDLPAVQMERWSVFVGPSGRFPDPWACAFRKRHANASSAGIVVDQFVIIPRAHSTSTMVS